jgi:hypothetical protein
MQKNSKKLIIHYHVVENNPMVDGTCSQCYRHCDGSYILISPEWNRNQGMAPKLIFCVHCCEKWGFISLQKYKELCYAWGIWTKKEASE